MTETCVLIVKKGPSQLSPFSAKPDVRAILVKSDQDCNWIPTFLENSGIVLGPGETFKVSFPVGQPEQIKVQLDELYEMLSADPRRKEALEWLLQRTYEHGFEAGIEEDFYRRSRGA